MANFIKMTRGSQAAYDKLKNAGTLDDNTLYFIYSDSSDTVGSLYLGSRLISGGDVQVQSASLSDLTDTTITEAAENDFLVYQDGVWKNVAIADVAESLGEELDEKLEEFDNILTEVDSKIEEALGDIDSKIADAVGELNSLSYKTVESLEDIHPEEEGADKFIYLVPNNADGYDEYLVVEGKVERIGDFTVNLENYVTFEDLPTEDIEKLQNLPSAEELESQLEAKLDKTVYQQEVGNLTELINRQVPDGTLVDEINAINQLLTWDELTEE